MTGRILVGTASWTDRSLLSAGWYPKSVSTAEERLAYYAEHFPLVEVDSTYYFLPSRDTAHRWVERTPKDFTFNVKAFSLLTQHPTDPKALPDGMAPEAKRRVYLRHLDDRAVDEIWDRFKGALAPLHRAGKLGAVLFQFPPWFSIKRQHKDYLAEGAERARPMRVAVEFRSPTWLTQENRDETFAWLSEHGLAYIVVDTGRRKGAVPAVEAATSKELAGVRFHGRARGKPGQPRSEQQYLYSNKVLESWVPRLVELAETAGEVHAVFRNVYEDYSVRSAERLQRLLAAGAVGG